MTLTRNALLASRSRPTSALAIASVAQSSIRPCGYPVAVQRQRMQRQAARRLGLRRPLAQQQEGEVAGDLGIERIGAEGAHLQRQRLRGRAAARVLVARRVVELARFARRECHAPHRIDRRAGEGGGRVKDRAVADNVVGAAGDEQDARDQALGALCQARHVVGHQVAGAGAKSGITSTPSTERMSDEALPVAAATTGVVPGSPPLPPDVGTTFDGAGAGGTGPPLLAVMRTGTAVPFAGVLPATAQG